MLVSLRGLWNQDCSNQSACRFGVKEEVSDLSRRSCPLSTYLFSDAGGNLGRDDVSYGAFLSVIEVGENP